MPVAVPERACCRHCSGGYCPLRGPHAFAPDGALFLCTLRCSVCLHLTVRDIHASSHAVFFVLRSVKPSKHLSSDASLQLVFRTFCWRCAVCDELKRCNASVYSWYSDGNYQAQTCALMIAAQNCGSPAKTHAVHA